MSKKEEEVFRWITVKGRKVPIRKGQSVKEAIQQWIDPKAFALATAEKKGKSELPLTKTQEKEKVKKEKEEEKRRKLQVREPKTMSQWRERASRLKQALAHCRKTGDFRHLFHEIERKQKQIDCGGKKDLDSIGITFEPIISETSEIIPMINKISRTDSIPFSEIIPMINKISRTDLIPFSEFRKIETDNLTTDFVIFHGPIVRDGPYDYEDEKGNVQTLYKEIDNLSDIYSRYKYLPIKASEQVGAHYAEELGYATNFSLNKETNEIEADLVLVNDENFENILKKKNEYHVSPGYGDIIEGNVQIVTDVDHIALALGSEIGRACTGTNSKGVSCTKVKKIYHDQNQIMEVV